MPDLTSTELVALIGASALFIPLITAALQYRQSVQQEYEKSFRAIVEKLSAGKKEERVAAASSLGTFIKKSDFTRKHGRFYDESIDVLVNTIAIELDHNVLNAIRGSLEKIEKEYYRDVVQKLLAIDTNSFVFEYPVRKRKVLAENDIKANVDAFSRLFEGGYLFSWDKIPGNDNLKLIEFLRQNFSIDWIKDAKIEKIDSKVVEVSTEEHFLSLRLDDEKTRVNLMIDDVRTDNFTVKAENGELNIYKENESEVNRMILNNLEKEVIFNQEMSSKFKRDLDELQSNDSFVINFISSFLNAKEFPMTNLKFYKNSMNEIVLSDLELTKSRIINSSFSFSIISRVTFEDVIVTNSVFTGSQITKSKFINSKIESSLFDQIIFADVDFSGSEFKDVYFTGADLTGVSFKGTKGLKEIYFYKAKNIDKARFDDMFKKELDETLKNTTEDEFKEYVSNKSDLTEQRRRDIFTTLDELKKLPTVLVGSW